MTDEQHIESKQQKVGESAGDFTRGYVQGGASVSGGVPVYAYVNAPVTNGNSKGYLDGR